VRTFLSGARASPCFTSGSALTLRTVTLLGAIDLGDRMLLAGDGQVILTDDGMATVREPSEKVWRLARTPTVMWGFTGESDVGYAFKAWLDAQVFSSWDQLQGAAVGQLALINGNVRAIAEVARAKRDGAEALICGYLAGESRRLVLASDGGAVTNLPNPVFIGGGAPHATVAWEALSRVVDANALRPAECFTHVMEAAADRLVALGLPVTTLEATRELPRI
jgi:ATP-dependent protease HslVU (ClpYQ) peptidase subunit